MTEPDPIFTCDDTPKIMPAGVTIADLDLANKAATAVQYLRLCPEAGPERIAALETVLIAADRFAQIMPKIEISIEGCGVDILPHRLRPGHGVRLSEAMKAYEVLWPNIESEMRGAEGSEAEEIERLWTLIGNALYEAREATLTFPDHAGPWAKIFKIRR